jgi:glycosyltransferase involved in cell wall biosynthesis
MQSSWVFVNPSMMEGWGITTTEASACGTPIVASDVPGLRESVQDGITGMLVPYGNVERLAACIIELLTNHQKREQYSVHAIAWAQRFSWRVSSDTFISLITRR